MIAIATVYGQPPEDALDALRDIPGHEVGYRKLHSLGGPNDVVQLLATGPEWVAIVKALVVVYGTEFLRKTAKNHAQYAWEHRAEHIRVIQSGSQKFLALVRYLLERRQAGDTVVLAIPGG
jgi:hypothetical protein